MTVIRAGGIPYFARIFKSFDKVNKKDICFFTMVPSCVISMLRIVWRASWHPTYPNCVGSPIVFISFRRHFDTIKLRTLAKVSLRHTCLQFLGFYVSPFSL